MKKADYLKLTRQRQWLLNMLKGYDDDNDDTALKAVLPLVQL